MKLLFRLTVFLLTITSCTENDSIAVDVSEKFTSELTQLKEYFQIPGIAASIEQDGKVIYENYLGFSDYEKKISLDSTHLFPIASLTKIFSGVLIMKLIEQQKVSLDEPIKKFFPESALHDSIQIKHILSHTSQGKIGEHFYYSSRFGALTRIIEMTSGKTFKSAMEEEIFEPLKLKNTFLLKDSAQIVQHNLRIAKPYALGDGVEKGFIDFGYSTSAGIVSNLKDLHAFNQALDNNTLISESSKKLMFTSVNEKLPYGYGIFNQEVNGEKLVWAYGQYDCYSSLFLKVPSKNITLTLLTNTNLMSDPARLIYGDVSSSLFALSFLKNYVFDFNEMDLFESEDSLSFNEGSETEFYRKKVLAQALSESFMARYDSKKMQTSTQLLEEVFSKYPNYLAYADINVLHNLTFLKDIAFYRELGAFNKFDNHIEQISAKLLKGDSQNPYLHLYMGVYYDRKGDLEKAKYHFTQIVNAKNFSKNWYTNEAQNWLKNNNVKF
ncbi:serine hydrolase [Flavobacteriaceae bacterium S356]|uniref:Serine hydrolase n=1 Tax=Asprobacillus argus TaxID=3076534 RepID=A0ABU3LGI0_9FLAO|nr:serine hydrolase [Flavobacteriaceae bacterium S356]